MIKLMINTKKKLLYYYYILLHHINTLIILYYIHPRSSFIFLIIIKLYHHHHIFLFFIPNSFFFIIINFNFPSRFCGSSNRHPIFSLCKTKYTSLPYDCARCLPYLLVLLELHFLSFCIETYDTNPKHHVQRFLR